MNNRSQKDEAIELAHNTKQKAIVCDGVFNVRKRYSDDGDSFIQL